MNWKPVRPSSRRSFFVRPAARKRIEAMANEAGLDLIDEAFFESAKAKFGQK